MGMGMASVQRIAVYPGTFDPITNGHVYILKRSLKIFDHLVVALAENVRKTPLFSIEERKEMIAEAVDRDPRIEVDAFGGLLVDYVRQRGATTVIRGLRALADFEYEFQMAGMNRQLMPDVETLFLTPSDQYQFVSGTFVREIATLSGDVSKFVSPLVLERLKQQVKRGNVPD